MLSSKNKVYLERSKDHRCENCVDFHGNNKMFRVCVEVTLVVINEQTYYNLCYPERSSYINTALGGVTLL